MLGKNISTKLDSFYLFFIILIWAIALFALYFIYYYKNQKKSDYFNENIITLEIAYKASRDKYSLLADYIFANSINNKTILSLFEKGLDARGEQRHSERYKLYQKLLPLYQKLQQNGIRQLHFFTLENRSYLRFHKPEHYGDDLSKLRQTVVFANQKNQNVSAFETGRVVSGFRNVFPLNYNHRHLGTVEISVTTKAILDTLHVLDPRREYRFILSKNVVLPKLFKEQKHHYTLSQIDSDFVLENYQDSARDAPTKLIKLTQKINQQLHQNKNLHQALADGKHFGVFSKIGTTFYDVSFVPMRGITGGVEGYLIAYKKSANIPVILKIYSLLYFSVILVALLMTLLLIVIRRNHTTIQYQREWFKSINDSLGEGLYVMDLDANIVYINPVACEILGYDEAELYGKSAHDIFHSHALNHDVPQQECPIFKGVLEHQAMTSEHEYFTCKNGAVIPVQLTSRPIYKNGTIHQIVTSFQDMSEKRKLEEQSDLLLRALEVSASTVVITNKDAIVEWANPAFEKLTGYKAEDVMGKNPSDFINSGKQTPEFYEHMWQTILSKKPWRGELINKRKDGTLYYEELTITPILNAEKEINHFVAVKQDISQRKKLENNLEHYAMHDALTNLSNRRYLTAYLERLFITLSDESQYVAILFLDLDDFKQLNDKYGHDIGDAILIEVANRLQRSVRKQDLVSRLGGDEFVIVLEGLPPNFEKAKFNAQAIAQKIKLNISSSLNLDSQTFHIGISIGVTLFHNNSKTVNQRIKEADDSLYHAKAQGKNLIYFYQDIF
ncbi:sensor domain-containing diguanylate cyclase [Sulfurospirillum sp. 1612]|uniref:sensor domain-containing diguanylate cyclase n=1 Tax=Sulfurospirillum sp. 1612 TaxID=3094835 RepID=UPI002F936B8B